ncbi:MAG: hypothetical protein ACLQIB_55515 [Isosphaeraceae bacterium]
MAGPTDILTEDVKDLREANRQLAAEIKVAFERVSGELRESNHRVADAINSVARDLGNFRVEVAKDPIFRRSRVGFLGVSTRLVRR